MCRVTVGRAINDTTETRFSLERVRTKLGRNSRTMSSSTIVSSFTPTLEGGVSPVEGKKEKEKKIRGKKKREEILNNNEGNEGNK